MDMGNKEIQVTSIEPIRVIKENKKAALGLALSLGIFTYNPFFVGVGLAGLGLFVADRGLRESNRVKERNGAPLVPQKVKTR